MRLILISFCLILSLTKTIAQSSNDLRSAERFFLDGDYYNALVNYERYLGIRKNPANAVYPYHTKKISGSRDNTDTQSGVYFRLAECFRKLNNFSNAEKWYAKSLEAKPANASLALLWYGVCLRANNKFAEARKTLNNLIKKYPREKELVNIARQEMANLDFIEKQISHKDAKLYTISKLQYINKFEGAYAPFITSNREILFTSAIADTARKKKNVPYYNRVFIASFADSSRDDIRIPITSSDAKTHQAGASITADNRKMYFTQWSGRTANAAIYMSTPDEKGNWSSPVRLDDKVNMPGYNAKHPFISADGKWMIFSSNMPNGAGGFDLWYTQFDENGKPGTPVNLAMLNTKDDEESPFYHAPSKSIVFSTNGRTGMGGFDLFVSRGDINNWTIPVNLGYPVNSVKNDLFFFSSSPDSLMKEALFSSDRNNDCCLEIYNVYKTEKKFKQRINLQITDCLSGNIIGAGVNIVSGVTGEQLFNGITSYNKGVQLETTSVYDSLVVFVHKQDFEETKETLVIHNEERNDTVFQYIICLNPVRTIEPPSDEDSFPTKMPMVVYFEFDKADISAETSIVLDSLVALMKREKFFSLEAGGYTDGKGTEKYNEGLGAARAKACIDYMVARGIEPSRLLLSSYGECCPVAPETTDSKKDNPEGRKLNRRVEFKLR